MTSPKKNLYIAIVIIVIAGAGAAWWYWYRAPEPLPDTTAGQEAGGLGAQIFEGTQNPIKNDVPETNPFAADANPFDADTNPYKDTYKNPF